MGVVEIKEQDFVKKTQVKDKKVLVDCYATWCGPCRMLSPIIDDLSEEITNYDFYKLDVDEAEEIARKYDINAIPALLIFVDGELKEKIIGFKTKEELKERLK